MGPTAPRGPADNAYNVLLRRWLETSYPDRPSLFLPSSTTPVNSESPEMQVARTYAIMFNAGGSYLHPPTLSCRPLTLCPGRQASAIRTLGGAPASS